MTSEKIAQVTIITPSSKWSFVDFRELYRFRQLLWSLAWRDIKVKYAQTFIGLLWAIINPLLTIIFLSFVFHRVAKVDTGNVPALLFTLTGYAAWMYFSTLLQTAGDSILSAQGMIQKIYFPRLILPLSKALSGLLEFAVILLCIFAFMFYYNFKPSFNIIYFPLFLLVSIITALTGGIWISALTVRYRDFRFITPFLVQLGLFITPIAYPSSNVPEKYLSLYFLNPMASVVEGFRWSLLGLEFDIHYLWLSVLGVIVMCILGLYYFSKVEKIMADII